MALLIYFYIFFLGAAFGSFLNVVALRYIKEESIGGRSHCAHCQKTLRWWELIPVFSYIFLQGKCARCHTPFSLQYMLVEVFTGLIFVAAFWPLPTSAPAIVLSCLTALFICWLIILFLIDLKTLILPDIFIIALSLTVLALLALSPYRPSLFSSLAGLATGSGFLLVLWLVTRGKGIGLGDVKLLLPLGALFGFSGIIILLWIAFSAGGIVGIYLLSQHKATLKTPLPFGPFLAGIAILLILFPFITHSVFSIVLGIS